MPDILSFDKHEEEEDPEIEELIWILKNISLINAEW